MPKARKPAEGKGSATDQTKFSPTAFPAIYGGRIKRSPTYHYFKFKGRLQRISSPQLLLLNACKPVRKTNYMRHSAWLPGGQVQRTGSSLVKYGWAEMDLRARRHAGTLEQCLLLTLTMEGRAVRRKLLKAGLLPG